MKFEAPPVLLRRNAPQLKNSAPRALPSRRAHLTYPKSIQDPCLRSLLTVTYALKVVTFRPNSEKSKLFKAGTLLDDTYNANPESMEAAIDTLAEIEIPDGAQRIMVLGKMGELGAHSEASHLRVGKLAAAKNLRFIAVGVGAEGIAEGGGVPHFSDIHKAADWLLENSHPGDVILFKGSRTAAIEKVLKTAFPTAC